MILRLYGPLERWFDKSWRPGEFELLKDVPALEPGGQPRMATDIPAAITTPDRVETRIGTLEFVDGFPTEETVELVYDNLDFLRGVEAFLTAMPAASVRAIRRASVTSASAQRDHDQSPRTCWTPVRSILTPTPRASTSGPCWTSRDGPMVVESPPNTLGMVNDFFFRYVADLGNAGPDKGKGGKYLFPAARLGGRDSRGLLHLPLADLREPAVLAWLPRGWRSRPRGEWRRSTADLPAGLAAGSARMRVQERLRALLQHDPRQRHRLLPRGPRGDRQRSRRGVQPGAPRPARRHRHREGHSVFEPDKRLRATLVEAVAVGNATARAISFRPRDPRAFYYENSAWFNRFVGGSHEFLRETGGRDLDARTMFHYPYIAVTPAMAIEMVGVGSQYAVAASTRTATTWTARRPTR